MPLPRTEVLRSRMLGEVKIKITRYTKAKTKDFIKSERDAGCYATGLIELKIARYDDRYHGK